MNLSGLDALLKGLESGLNSIAKAKGSGSTEGDFTLVGGTMNEIDTNGRYSCYRNICGGTMLFDVSTGQFVCRKCGAKAWPDELRDHINGEIDLNVGDTYNGVKGYSFAYDPDGNHFKCPICGGNVMDDDIHDRQICSICGHVITSDEFDAMLSEWDRSIGGDGDIWR